MIAWIHWNPKPYAFRLPIIEHPIAWYGILFAAGFFLAYLILVPMISAMLNREVGLKARDIENWLLFRLELCKHADLAFQKIGRIYGEKDDLSTRQPLLDMLNKQFFLTRYQWRQKLPNALLSSRSLSIAFVDKLTWFVIIGTVVGARLGHVVFYDLPLYLKNPIHILYVWEGGLASHGAAIGIICALVFFLYSEKSKFLEITFLKLLDAIVVVTCIAAVCIRIGNFINQEIVGKATSVPWAIVFANPAGAIGNVPRHPVQLYEAAAYLISFFVLHKIWWAKIDKPTPGLVSGVFFLLIFGNRFILEFFKVDQGGAHAGILNTGQLLSIPFLVIGTLLIFRGKSECAPSCSSSV